jgi:hypothetical protein
VVVPQAITLLAPQVQVLPTSLSLQFTTQPVLSIREPQSQGSVVLLLAGLPISVEAPSIPAPLKLQLAIPTNQLTSTHPWMMTLMMQLPMEEVTRSDVIIVSQSLSDTDDVKVN